MFIKRKIKSFTLSELIVVIIITAIVVGIAFSVLLLVKKQLFKIETNYNKTTTLALFEERFWRDFNQFQNIKVNEEGNGFILKNEIDSVFYSFEEDYLLRNEDTIALKIAVQETFLEGKEVTIGAVDAVRFSAVKEIPDYTFFIFRSTDAAQYMIQNGF